MATRPVAFTQERRGVCCASETGAVYVPITESWPHTHMHTGASLVHYHIRALRRIISPISDDIACALVGCLFHSSQPADLHSSFHACHSTRSLGLPNTNLLSAPFVHTSFGTRSFSVAADKIWNSLPPSLRTCTSPDTFRRHLKTHYCQQSFQST